MPPTRRATSANTSRPILTSTGSAPTAIWRIFRATVWDSATTSTTTAAPTTTSTTTQAGTTTTTSTTTAAGPCQVSLSPSNIDGATACDNWNNVIDRTAYYALYSGCSATNGQQLYTDSGLTTLIPNNWYSDGTNYFQVVGGNGTLTNSTACPGPTTTSTTTAAPTTTSTTTAAPTTTTTTTAAPTYSYLGRSSPDAASSGTACSTYSTIRGYTSLKSSLASIAVSDIFYDAYPSTPTNGGGNWIALKAGGVGDAYSFQINASGVVTAVGGNCSGGTTTTTTAAPTTTTTTTAAPTTTTTTTAAPGGGFISITNSGGFGASIDDVTPAWFIITSVSGLPVGSGQVASGDHSGYSGNFGVTVSAATGLELKLVVNSSVVSSQIISADGMYTFTGVSIPSNANVDIQLLVSA